MERHMHVGILSLSAGLLVQLSMSGAACRAADDPTPPSKLAAPVVTAKGVVDGIAANGTNLSADKRLIVTAARTAVPEIKAAGHEIAKDLDVKSGSPQQKALILNVGKTAGQIAGSSIGSTLATDVTAPLGSPVQNYASQRAGAIGGTIGANMGTEAATVAIKNQARCVSLASSSAKAIRKAGEQTGAAAMQFLDRLKDSG